MLRFKKTAPEVSSPARKPKVELVIALEDFDVTVAVVQVFLNSEKLELHWPLQSSTIVISNHPSYSLYKDLFKDRTTGELIEDNVCSETIFHSLAKLVNDCLFGEQVI